MTFLYSPQIIQELESSLSIDRFSKYLGRVSGDKEAALKLYLWNSEVSAAFYLPLQGLEVALRNALHAALSKHYGGADWYDRVSLDPYGTQQIQKAKTEVAKQHKTVNPPHVVAELSFGFWVSLLGTTYHQSLWIPALYSAFPNGSPHRKTVSVPFSHLRAFRNRIAHHEPIFDRQLSDDYSNIITSLGWISPAKAAWINHHSPVMKVLALKPIP